jgi:hypothetical protein
MIRYGLLLALLLTSTVAHADCADDEEREALTRQGLSSAEIDAICNLRETDFPDPAGAIATYCETDGAFCLLAAPVPAGAECTCATPRGPMPGVAE